MEEKDRIRIDKYLWSIRVFKTRNLAAEACNGGKVKLNGQNLKPSHSVKKEDIYHIQKGSENKIIKVKSMIEKRVDNKTAILCYEDLSLPNTEENRNHTGLFYRDKGAGRPTKKDRRALDNLRNEK